jgi:hypothetical protein
MSGHADQIGGWISLILFAILLVVGGWPHDTLAQPAPQLCAPAATQGWWPGDAPIFGALVAGIFAFVIAEIYTKRLKQIEATLEFSKRFHELIQQQRVINRRYKEDRTKTGYISDIDQEDAKAWWWRVFDLMLYEYDFYQKGMVRKKRFEEWMVWRWHDYHPEPGREWSTCGIDYKKGFEIWKDHPAHGSRLIDLLEEIHNTITIPSGLSDEDRNELVKERVRNKVRPHGPRLWKWWTDLDLGR